MTVGAVLARKAGIAPKTPPDPMPALRRALRRAMDATLGHDLEVGEGGLETRPLRDLLGSLATDDLVIALERGGTLAGALVLPPPLWRSLVEVQTLGRQVLPRRAARGPTGTDAALCLPFLSRLLDEVIAGGGAALGPLLDGVALGARIDLPRIIELSLPAEEVACLSCSCALAPDEAAPLRLFLARSVPAPAATAGGDDAPDWAAQWSEVAPQIPARLEAVLHRMPLDLSVLRGLSVGQVIALEGADLGRLRLESAGHRLAAGGRLGRLGALRAVRIGPPPAYDMQEMPLTSAAPFGAGVALDFPDPEGPVADVAPALPEAVPDLPGMTDAADTPEGAGLPDLPDMAVMPAAPDLPDMGGGGGLDLAPTGVDLPLAEAPIDEGGAGDT